MQHGTTCLATCPPWGLITRKGTRLLCSDGTVRSVAYIAQSADTFFSVPTAVRIRGKYITGYATGDEAVHPDDMGRARKAYTFRAHTEQPGNPLPQEWPENWTQEKWDLFQPGAEDPAPVSV